MTFDDFKKTLPNEVVDDREKLLRVCKAAGVDVPLSERFYLKRYTPRGNRHNPNPAETEFVVIPHPLSRRELWVRREDFAKFLDSAQEFKQKLGL